jgi:glucose/arabinose dehydrogenase
MDFTPTGELWVLQQAGQVKLVRSDGTTFTAATLTVDHNGERGLLGLAFDPSYDGTGPNQDFVYLYYTSPTPAPHNRVSRFTVNNAGTSTPTLTNETVILDLENLGAATNHNGGALHFGPDGKLYLAVGDNHDGTTPPQNQDAQRLTSRFGKILRINTDGTAPSDNPFYVGNDPIRDDIWALGLRNPFTTAFQPGTNRFFIDDVGENTWEEINDGIAGANYGWAGYNANPLIEGFQSSPPSWLVNGTYHNPLMAYDHSSSPPTPSGEAITGGTFYNPATPQFGSSYVGKYFFADLGGSFIRIFDPANPGSLSTPDTSTDFGSSLSDPNIVDLKVDSGGSLYYLGYGNGVIYRIFVQATAPTITQQPVSVTVATGGTATFTVTATGSAPLSYQWQKLSGGIWGNVTDNSSFSGSTTATLSITNVQLKFAGQYRVIVSNSAGSATSDAATLTVQQAGTAPSITRQPTSVTVTQGQTATFTVTATGSAPLSYQWQRLVSGTWLNVSNGGNVSGATTATLTISNAVPKNAGTYRVVVSNSFGSATSNTATLTVNTMHSQKTAVLFDPKARLDHFWSWQAGKA